MTEVVLQPISESSSRPQRSSSSTHPQSRSRNASTRGSTSTRIPVVRVSSPTGFGRRRMYLTGHGMELAPVQFSRRNPVELVIFCGSPGSGKSTFYWNTLKPLGYERVNQDILKSVRSIHPSIHPCFVPATLPTYLSNSVCRTNQSQRPKCLKVAREHLTAGRSVAVGMLGPVRQAVPSFVLPSHIHDGVCLS